MIEQRIYDALKRHRICDSEEQFSVDFMEKSRKYFGVCKARQGRVSLSARIMLLERIRYLEEMSASQARTNNKHDPGFIFSMHSELASLRRRLANEEAKQCLDGFCICLDG